MVMNETLALTHDIWCESTTPCLTVHGPEAILDCQGFQIRSDPSCNSFVAILMREGASLTNCLIHGFAGDGIDVEGDLDVTIINFPGIDAQLDFYGANEITENILRPSLGREHSAALSIGGTRSPHYSANVTVKSGSVTRLRSTKVVKV